MNLIGSGEPLGVRSKAIDLRISAERNLASASAFGLALTGAGAAFFSPCLRRFLHAASSSLRAASTAALIALANAVASFAPDAKVFFAAAAVLIVSFEAPFSLPALSAAAATSPAAFPAAVAASDTALTA